VPPEALPVKLTLRGAGPAVGSAEAVAVSWEGAEVTVIVTDFVAVAEVLSLTVRVDV
jgi:hypothetical protein